MSESFKDDTSSAPEQVEVDVLAVLKRMQQQLGFLEKKLDALIKQSSERPFRDKPFSKPFRPAGFSHSQGHGKGEQGPYSRERGFSQGRRFDKPRGQSQGQSRENRGFGQTKKPFFRQQRDR